MASFVPQISTNKGTKTYKPAPKPVYQTPAPKQVYQSTQTFVPQISTNKGISTYTAPSSSNNNTASWSAPTLPSYTPITYNYPTATQNNATTDFANLLKGLVSSVNPLTNLTGGGATASKNLLGGLVGTLGTAGTQIAKAVAPAQYSGLQSLTGKSNPFEFNLSEALSGISSKIAPKVVASEPSYNLKTTPTPTANPDSSYKVAQQLKQRLIDVNNGKVTPPTGTVTTDSINALLTDPNIVASNKQAESLQKVNDLKQQLASGKISKSDYNNAVYNLLVGPTPTPTDNSTGTGTDNSTGTNYSPELQAVVNNIQSLEKTQSTKYDQLVNEINSGAKSEQDAANEWAKTQQDIENAKYDALNNALKSQLPLIESNYTSSYNQDVAQKQAALDAINKQKVLNTNTTGENIAASVSNQKSEEARLRNVFSNLGTADSTYFVDALTKAAQQGGQNQNAIQNQGSANEATYNTNATTTTNTYDKLLADLLLGKNTDIANVNNQVNTNEANRTSDLGTVLQNLANVLSTSNSNATANRVKTYAQQIADQNANDNMINTYQLNDLTAKKQSDYSTQAIKGQQNKLIISSGNNKYARPQGFSSDLWASASNLIGQGLRGSSLIQALKAQGISDASPWMYNYLLNASPLA